MIKYLTFRHITKNQLELDNEDQNFIEENDWLKKFI